MKATPVLLALVVGAPLFLPGMHASSHLPCNPLVCVDPGRDVDVKPLPGADACREGVTEFTFTLHSGLDAQGAFLATGDWDRTWRAGPAAPSGLAFAKDDNSVPSVWWDSLVAQWINPYPGAQISGPLSDFVYGAAFAIPLNAYGVSVSGQFAVDNSGVASLPPSTVTFSSPLNGFSSPTGFSWSNVGTGPQLLRVDVHNRPSSGGFDTPTGLIVEAEVHGYCKPSGPILGLEVCKDGARHFTIDLSTGRNPLGGLLANNAMDANWTSPFPTPSATYAHTPEYTGWVPPTVSRWINTNPSGYADPVSPTTRTYQVNYYLPPNAVNTALQGQFAADNEGVMSDTTVQQSTWLGSTVSGTGFQQWTPIIPQSNLDPGYHSVTVSVTDFGVVTGLVVEAYVTGECRDDLKDVKDVLDRVV